MNRESRVTQRVERLDNRWSKSKTAGTTRADRSVVGRFQRIDGESDVHEYCEESKIVFARELTRAAHDPLRGPKINARFRRKRIGIIIHRYRVLHYQLFFCDKKISQW